MIEIPFILRRRHPIFQQTRWYSRNKSDSHGGIGFEYPTGILYIDWNFSWHSYLVTAGAKDWVLLRLLDIVLDPTVEMGS